jgi:hypothetical protein
MGKMRTLSLLRGCIAEKSWKGFSLEFGHFARRKTGEDIDAKVSFMKRYDIYNEWSPSTTCTWTFIGRLPTHNSSIKQIRKTIHLPLLEELIPLLLDCLSWTLDHEAKKVGWECSEPAFDSDLLHGFFELFSPCRNISQRLSDQNEGFFLHNCVVVLDLEGQRTLQSLPKGRLEKTLRSLRWNH